MSLYYKPYSETQPLDPTLGGGPYNSLSQTKTKRRVKIKIKKMLPYIGIVAVALVIVSAAVVIFVSSGHTFQKPLSETDPALYYSNVAGNALAENLNTRTTTNVMAGCEATVMIMRHCERYFARTDKNKNEYCGYLGMERASYLTTLFGDVASTKHPSRWPTPSKIYAMSPQRPNTDQRNYRQADTMQPLAEKVGVLVDTSFTSGEEYRLAKAVFKDLRHGKMCGTLTLVSWSHEIPELAQQLGCGPYNGCPLEFTEFMYDAVYQIKFVYDSPQTDAVEEQSREEGEDDDDDVNVDEDDSIPIVGGTKSFFRHRNKEVEAWEVHGSVAYMNFDPLSFSAKVGDYPQGGKAAGGSWRAGSL